MTRPLRLLVPDGTYHAVARGIDQTPLFHDDADRERFLRLLGRVVSRMDWVLLAYCLMDNHFHLLVRTPQANIDRGMQQLNSGYAQGFNRRHGRTGHLFQGRFHAPLIQRDAHVMEVIRYIALNPVRAGIVRVAQTYPWSSYAATIGAAPAPSFLAVGEVLSWFGDEAGRYVGFVEAGSLREHPDVEGVVFGDEEFAREVLPDERPPSEIARADWTASRPLLRKLFDGTERDRGIAIAYRRYGYPLSAIAFELGLHVSTVSRAMRRFEEAEEAA